MGNQTLRCLFPLLCVQSSLPQAHLWRSDTLGGWPLARQAVGAGLSARGKATGKDRLSPALGAEPPAFPQLPWPVAQPYHPCCGSQAPSVDPEAENPFSIPREKRCPHTQLGEQLSSSCLQVVLKITRSHQTALEVGKGDQAGCIRLYSAREGGGCC